MNEATQHVRIDSINKAKKAWRLQKSGMDINDIAKSLSMTTNTVSEIIKYTNFTYYLTVKPELSYCDTKSVLLQRVSNERKKLKAINTALEYKKDIFFKILKATSVFIVLLILI